MLFYFRPAPTRSGQKQGAEFDAEAALARLLLPETPVLLDTTLEQLLHEADVCPHQPADAQSNIQQEQTPQELHQLPQELNAKFARTVKFLEERREPRVQNAVLVLCQADQACCPPHSSGGVFANPKAVKEAIEYLQTKAEKVTEPLRWSEELVKAAKEHVEDTGPKGLLSHESSSGGSVKDRLQKYGKIINCYGENLSFHCDTAVEIL